MSEKESISKEQFAKWEVPKIETETAKPPQEQELEKRVAPESKKEKGIMVKIGEKVREYAPSVISGAAGGALLGELGRLDAMADIRIAELLTGPLGKKIEEIMSAPFGTERALWVAIGAGLGAIGAGLLKKWREEPKGFR